VSSLFFTPPLLCPPSKKHRHPLDKRLGGLQKGSGHSGVLRSFEKLWGRWVFCEGVSKSFLSGRLERELQMVQLSATRCSCIAILWISLVSFAAITLCVASQRVFIVIVFVVYFVKTQSGKFCIHPRVLTPLVCKYVRVAQSI
jgi:hypothetical protein